MNKKAKRLVVGWRVLGLLDESRIMPWIREGGMLAVSMQRRADNEEEESEGDEDDEGGDDKADRVVAGAV